MHDFAENIKYDAAVYPVVLNGAANTPIYFPMTNYDKIAIIVQTGANAGGGTLTIQLRQRIGTGGTEANLGTATTAYTTANGATIIEAAAADMTLASGYDRIGVLITNGGSSNFYVSAIACRFNTRFGQASPLS